MRSMLAATLICVAAAASAQAQMSGTAARRHQAEAGDHHSDPPGLQTPADTANAMAQAERLSLQSDLAWVGQYNGAITGEVSERMVAAIKEFQKERGGKQTGVLNPQERGVLAETAQTAAGQCRLEDHHRCRHRRAARHSDQAGAASNLATPTAPNGVRPPAPSRSCWRGARKPIRPRRNSPSGKRKSRPVAASTTRVVKPDFFVLSGMQGLKKFYLRGTFKGDEVRILTILYDQATEGTVEPVVIAMSSAFNPFPSGALIAGPPPPKSVEYGTGIVVSNDGVIVADRLVTDNCLAITIPGYGHADRIAEDKDHDLALLHIYGARGLKPLGLSGGAAKSVIELSGIADPQNQGGAAAASTVKANVAQANSGGDAALSPAPALGFSGAAALDADGKFAGVALLKPVVVAGPPNAALPAQAMLVPADTVREFLKANGVMAADGSSDAKASVVRVICVRK